MAPSAAPAAAMGAALGTEHFRDEHFQNFGVFGHQDSGGSRGGSPAPPAVLVLGGSTFMGRETVQALLSLPARVCMVNRGRSYWGVEDASGGRAARVLADRRRAEAFAARLDEATARLGVERWALVADFSAYNTQDMRAALAGLRGRFHRYVYISSDSVYEVSAWAAAGWSPQALLPGADGHCVAECSSQRPGDQAARRRLRKADGYGDDKLHAEEALASGVDACPGCRGLALRLPDVIGPFDDTHRLFAYWHWLQAGSDYPPQCHAASPSTATSATKRARSGQEAPLAFVFSRDVARFIAGLVGSRDPHDAPAFDAVNLACLQQPTLREFLCLLAEASGLDSPPTLAHCASPRTFLPSVERPWPLDCGRMRNVYNFEPTPLGQVLRVCAEWFREACLKFPPEAARAAKKLRKSFPAVERAALLGAGLSAEPSSSSSSSGGSGSSDEA